MDTPTGDFQRGAIRVSDAERDQAVAELSEHYQSGRLTLEEFDDRSNRALQARTGTDLSALFADLPKGISTTGTPVSAGIPSFPASPGRRHTGGPSVARVVIACVIASIILGNVASGLGHHLHLGWLAPVLILGFVFLRLSRHR
jgi:Domain of unknown function (DUF1707)